MFAGLQKISNYFLDRWTGDYGYYEKQQENCIKRLQVFLDKNKISIGNVEEVDRWVKKEAYVSVLVFQGENMVYSSYPVRPDEETILRDGIMLEDEGMPEGEEVLEGGGVPKGEGVSEGEGVLVGERVSESAKVLEGGGVSEGERMPEGEDVPESGSVLENEGIPKAGNVNEEIAIDDVSGARMFDNLYTVRFTDASASVFLFSYHELLYYRLTAVVEGVLSFLLFISLFLWFIRKKTSYIELLKDDLQILEGGNLDYVVNVRGSDELAELAEGINRMRCSIIVRDEEEKRMRKANQDLVTAMSHDLRTPLTSLLGYLELLDDGGYEEEQQKRFIRNSRQKAVQIKEMSDCLFEYFLVYGKASEEIAIEEADAMALVQQTVCEEAYALEGKNFTVTIEMEEVTCPLMVNTDLFRRLIDNLFSNLVKYADPSAPVTITYRKAAGGISLTFCNKKNQAVGMVESSGIGLKTCWKIMREHGGRFDIQEDDESFQVILFFPEIAV